MQLSFLIGNAQLYFCHTFLYFFIRVYTKNCVHTIFEISRRKEVNPAVLLSYVHKRTSAPDCLLFGSICLFNLSFLHVLNQRSQCIFVFCRLYSSSSQPPPQCLAPSCHLFTLLTNTVSSAQTRLSI